MPALPPIMTTVCPASSGSRRVETGVVVVVTIPPHADRLATCASIGLADRGLSMIRMRSDITAAS